MSYVNASFNMLLILTHSYCCFDTIILKSNLYRKMTRDSIIQNELHNII